MATRYTLIHSGKKLSGLAATTSAELAGVISDETGSGSLVFATGPSLSKITLAAGTATAGTAPIKLTAGTLLSTSELGAIEYTDDGTNGHIYFTLNQSSTKTRIELGTGGTGTGDNVLQWINI